MYDIYSKSNDDQYEELDFDISNIEYEKIIDKLLDDQRKVCAEKFDSFEFSEDMKTYKDQIFFAIRNEELQLPKVKEILQKEWFSKLNDQKLLSLRHVSFCQQPRFTDDVDEYQNGHWIGYNLDKELLYEELRSRKSIPPRYYKLKQIQFR